MHTIMSFHFLENGHKLSSGHPSNWYKQGGPMGYMSPVVVQ